MTHASIQPTLIAIAAMIGIDTFAQRASAPANDHFQNVRPVALGVGSSIVFSDDNTGATIDDDFAPGSIADINWGVASVWHAIIINVTCDITLDLCGTRFAQPGAFAEYLFPGKPDVDDPLEATEIRPTACGDGNYAMDFQAVKPGTYYIAVGFIPGIAEGRYTMKVTAEPPLRDVAAH